MHRIFAVYCSTYMGGSIASTADCVGLILNPVSHKVDRIKVQRTDTFEAVDWQPHVRRILG